MYLQNQGWSRNSEIPKDMKFSRQMKTRYIKNAVLVRCWDHGYKVSVTGQIKFRLNFFHLPTQSKLLGHFSVFCPSQICCSQDLVSYSSCNCDITAFPVRKRKRARRKKKASVDLSLLFLSETVGWFICLLALINSWIIRAKRQRKLRINLAEKILTWN